MSQNLLQVFTDNPATVMQANDISYLIRSPYGASDDFGILWSDTLNSISTQLTTISGLTSITFSSGGLLKSGSSASDTLKLTAHDVDGGIDTTFITLTSNNTPTCDLDPAVTVGGLTIATTSSGTNSNISSLTGLNGTNAIRFSGESRITSASADSKQLTINGRDIDGATDTPFITITSANTPTCDLSTSVTIGGASIATGAANSNITSLSGITGNINLNAAPTTGNTSGIIISLTAGENLSFGDVCYIKAADGKAYKADATDSTKFPCRYFAAAAISSGNAGNFLRTGIATLSSWTWTVGGQLFLSTSGAMTQTAPSGSGNCIQVLGIALSATKIDFNSNANYITHV